MQIERLGLVLAASAALGCGGTMDDSAQVGRDTGASTGTESDTHRGTESDCYDACGDRERLQRGDDDRTEEGYELVRVGEDVCIKIEGGFLGAEGIDIDLGLGWVTVDGWYQKDDSPGEQIGFDWTAGCAYVEVHVKAGGETWVSLLEDDMGTWIHPNGTTGPEASGISNIVFCALERAPVCDDGAGGAGGSPGTGGAGDDEGTGGAGGDDGAGGWDTPILG